ncbi:hypothetical protein ACWEOZ_32210 [Actinoplanes sp. NPDC004185]
MPQVVIQPSYGNPDAWRHWEDTLDKEVDFTTPARRAALSVDERLHLERLHPSGTARFWGATGNHDVNMAKLTTGDVILFTGKKLVRAIGEVGYSFCNARFADTLWSAHEDRGSYRNVYSLLSFQPTDIPYEEVWELPGFNAGDNFMGLRFVDDTKGATLIDGLRIETRTSAFDAGWTEEQVTAALSGAQKIALEAIHTSSTSYEQAQGTTLVHRAEALLVESFRETLDPGIEVCRTRTADGITDLYIVDHGRAEIVEAKRDAGRRFVRQALAQLLDYAPHSPEPLTRLTALFPTRPAAACVELLHRYGCDCVFRTAAGTFTRLPAPRAAFEHMAKRWA